MKVGLLSDIHGNLPALQAVLSDLKHCQKILCMGDITGYGPFPSEVLDLILGCPELTTIAGNHDCFVSDNTIDLPKDAIVRNSVHNTRQSLISNQIATLQSLPLQWHEKIDGKSVLMVHGSPWCPLSEYIYPDYQRWEYFQELSEDVIIMGHTHHAFFRKVGNKLIINPGSCGQARDMRGKASYAIWDTQKQEVELYHIEYPVEQVIEQLRILSWSEELIPLFQPGKSRTKAGII